jgi:hypothetical protein
MSYQLKKINNNKVEIPQLDTTKKKYKGDDLFDIQYFCMTLLGKRRSGKSSLIYTLLKKFTTKKTIVLFFVPTFHKDKTYEPIRKYLEKNKITYDAYSSVEEDGVNMIETFMEVNSGFNEDKKKEIKEENKPVIENPCKFECDEEKKNKNKKRKKEETPPEYFIIFDDMSGYLRKPSVLKLIKNSRHFRAKIVISTQSVSDVHPHVFGQMDYIALFKNFNEDSLDFLYEKIQLGITLEEFKKLYYYVTSQTFGNNYNCFLLIHMADETFYMNLDKQVTWSELDQKNQTNPILQEKKNKNEENKKTP